MKHVILSVVLIFFSMVTGWTQQNIFAEQGHLLSPVIQEGNRVTLSLRAPYAKKVEVKGDWMLSGIPEAMQKTEEGIWSYTSPELDSDLYIYQFIVDGTVISDPLNVYQVRDVSSLFSYFIIEGEQGNLYQVNNIPHGTVTKRWYSSPTLEMERRMTIYTPPGYESGNQSYPVLYLLHGMGGDEEAWPTLGRAVQIIDNLIAAGKCKPMIIAMPNGNVVQQAAPGESSSGQQPVQFFLPHTMDGVYEQSFKDVITFVENNYRVIQKKEQRAIAGLSMGGYHSLWISVNYPNTFGYVGLFSPAIYPGRHADPKEGVPSIYEKMDEKLAQQRDNGFSLYWIAIGKDDFLFEQVANYRKKLEALNFPFQYVETNKGHVWSNWRIYLSEFAGQLFDN